MRLWALAVCAGVLAPLSGCDTIYGVGSYAELKTMPNIICIDRTLRHLPGIEVIHFEQPYGSSGPIWNYKTKAGEALLQIEQTAQAITYRNGDETMGHQVPVSEMQAIEPNLNAVNSAVFAACHLQAKTPLSWQHTT